MYLILLIGGLSRKFTEKTDFLGKILSKFLEIKGFLTRGKVWILYIQGGGDYAEEGLYLIYAEEVLYLSPLPLLLRPLRGV